MRLQWLEMEGEVCIRVTGPAGLVAVYPASLAGAGVQPMAGRLVAGCFVPRFPFMAGTSYTVVLDDGESLCIERPARDGERTRVVAVYPSGPAIPRNALRLYVHFSSPMSEGDARTHVDFCGALLPTTHELWDPERRRLTLLLDPGRIKRGLAPHDEAGYPLAEDGVARLTVGPGMRDSEGRPLASGFEKQYSVGPDVRELVMPSRWACVLPAPGSWEPLVVEFGRPLDHGLLQHCLRVFAGRGEIAGTGEAGTGESSWRFTPAAAWEPGGHRIVVDPVLEDVAGNSVVRVFDRDLRRQDEPRSGGPAELAFTVGS